MSVSPKNIEIERIGDLLRLEIRNRPSEEFTKSFLRQIESLTPPVLKTFRSTLMQTLTERESSNSGHLKAESLMELLDLCQLQVWLVESGVHERAARTIIRGIKSRSTEEFNRIIHTKSYVEYEQKDLLEFLYETGIETDDADVFARLVTEMDISVTEIIHRVFKLNFTAETILRQEMLRGTMTLKEIVSLYLYTFLEISIGDFGIEEDVISEIAGRLALCNNMKRQFLLVKQIERYFFSAASVEENQSRPKDFWLKLINDYELKTALEQYVTDDKLKHSTMELAELYEEASHIFDDVSELKDMTLAVISITYRLDNPEETGHTVEELLAIIDQIKLLTMEMGPLSIMTRDIFSFFEILGESDHHNRFFHKTIIAFRGQLRKIVDQNEMTGERVTLEQLVLAYLQSRLKAFLEDYEGPREKHLDMIRKRLSTCHDLPRQFSILDHVEEHIYENPGLLLTLGAPDKYWPELINTFELNIMLEIYIEHAYLVPGQQDMTKRQMLESLQRVLNGIPEISIKSLTVVFFTAHLAAMLDQAKRKSVNLDDIMHTIDSLRKDAEMAARQITTENRLKHDLLITLTEKLFRLETIQHALEDHAEGEIVNRLDEVIVGLRTRRDNLIGGKMDANVLDNDIRSFLSDAKVISLIDDAEKIYKDDLAHHAKAAVAVR